MQKLIGLSTLDREHSTNPQHVLHSSSRVPPLEVGKRSHNTTIQYHAGKTMGDKTKKDSKRVAEKLQGVR